MELYRYQLGRDYNDQPKLNLLTFPVVRESQASYWIQLSEWFPEKQKIVRKDARKTYAYSTQKKALYNYIRRTRHRINFLERDLRGASSCLMEAEALYSKLHT